MQFHYHDLNTIFNLLASRCGLIYGQAVILKRMWQLRKTDKGKTETKKREVAEKSFLEASGFLIDFRAILHLTLDTAALQYERLLMMALHLVLVPSSSCNLKG